MYQVLARKYRPRNFNELVGQNHVSRALTSALERGRLHHAYLFTGTRGVGKTTIARILAKCLNCETGITSTPCEVCATCTAVNEGRFIDLIEIDAASRTKVEDTRELLDNVPYAPTQGRFKVYLIDEVHMLSTHSFNALLKTLEEPPEHVKFLFATTDPQKLPITVISRCLQFTLRPLAVDEITHHLSDILLKEEIHNEQDAIWQIAESAQGSLRDALSLTDQAIAYGQGAIHHQDVKEMLGLIDRTIIYDLILAIHQNQRATVSQLLLQFRQQALDVSLVLDQFISTLHELAMLQYLPDLSLKYSAEINQKIMQLSQVLSPQDLQLYYQIACKGRVDLQLAVTQEQGFEMTVLRLLAFRPLKNNEVIVSASNVQHQNASTTQTISAANHDVSELKSIQSLENQVEQNSHIDEQASSDIESVESIELDPMVSNLGNDDLDESFLLNADIKKEKNQVLAINDSFEDQALDLNVNAEQTVNEHLEDHQDTHQYNHQEDNQKSFNVEHNNSTELSEQSQAPTLTLFQSSISDGVSTQATASIKVTDVASLSDQEVFFLDPHRDTEHFNLNNSVNNEIIQNNFVDESTHIETKTISVSPIISSANLNPIATASTQQTPQDILKLIPIDLVGEWDVNKWEYWFRNSELSPAVQELAQHGVMSGQIDGECIFHIPQQYEKILNQAQYDLEGKLKQQWTNTHFVVQFEQVSATTPFALQNHRKQRAYDRAFEMLHQETVVKNLINAFEGELQNIQLK